MIMTSSAQRDKIGSNAPSKGWCDAGHVSSSLDDMVHGQRGHRVAKNVAFQISVQNYLVKRNLVLTGDGIALLMFGIYLVRRFLMDPLRVNQISRNK